MFYPSINNHPPHCNSDIQGVYFVDGIEEAKSYSIPFGSRTFFMDKNDDRFYIRDVGFDGIESLSEYEFKRVEPAKPPEYVTKEDFEIFANKIFEKLGANDEPTIFTETD